jgi:hypothetical protein
VQTYILWLLASVYCVASLPLGYIYRFQNINVLIFRAMSVKTVVFWVMTSYSLVGYLSAFRNIMLGSSLQLK